MGRTGERAHEPLAVSCCARRACAGHGAGCVLAVADGASVKRQLLLTFGAAFVYWVWWMASEPGAFRTILIMTVCLNAFPWLFKGLAWFDGYLLARDAMQAEAKLKAAEPVPCWPPAVVR